MQNDLLMFELIVLFQQITFAISIEFSPAVTKLYS